MAVQPLIEVVGVKKSFWTRSVETPVLREIDLLIHDRDRLVITGASGAGKSTLLHILASLDPPTGGHVLFRGMDLYQKKDNELSRLRNEQFGFIFQFHHLMPEFTALENVMMPLLIRGISRAEAKQRAAELLEGVSLSFRLQHRPAELSGGEQQRVAIARALVGKPAILFADEPTGNLDRENGEKLMSLLLNLHEKEGMALVMITHNDALARQFPQKKVLADGRLSGGQ